MDHPELAPRQEQLLRAARRLGIAVLAEAALSLVLYFALDISGLEQWLLVLPEFGTILAVAWIGALLRRSGPPFSQMRLRDAFARRRGA
jgi:hypothetical protein